VDSGPEIEIEKAELFRVLPAEDLRKLRSRLHRVSFERQHVLYFENTEGGAKGRKYAVCRGGYRVRVLPAPYAMPKTRESV